MLLWRLGLGRLGLGRFGLGRFGLGRFGRGRIGLRLGSSLGGGSVLAGSGLGSSLAGCRLGRGGGGAAATGVGFGASFLATSGRGSPWLGPAAAWPCATPNRSLVTSPGVTRSTAIGSGSATCKGASVWMVSTAQPRTAACRHREMISPKCTLPFRTPCQALLKSYLRPAGPGPCSMSSGPLTKVNFWKPPSRTALITSDTRP